MQQCVKNVQQCVAVAVRCAHLLASNMLLVLLLWVANCALVGC